MSRQDGIGGEKRGIIEMISRDRTDNVGGGGLVLPQPIKTDTVFLYPPMTVGPDMTTYLESVIDKPMIISNEGDSNQISIESPESADFVQFRVGKHDEAWISFQSLGAEPAINNINATWPKGIASPPNSLFSNAAIYLCAQNSGTLFACRGIRQVLVKAITHPAMVNILWFNYA